MNNIYIRGDTHGRFDWLHDWCVENNTTKSDILIILGDAALRFEGQNKTREFIRKQLVAKEPITIFCLTGNHDRPLNDGTDLKLTKCSLINNQLMWHDADYPNIWYFQNGQKYIIQDKTFLILNGAYSIDKEYRLLMRWIWYEGEQATPEEQEEILQKVQGKQFDFILSHTCPYDWMPRDLFMTGIDQSKVDKRTELWLQNISKTVEWKSWISGHYHCDRINDVDNRHTILFNKIVPIEKFNDYYELYTYLEKAKYYVDL